MKYKQINIEEKHIYFDLDNFQYVSGNVSQQDNGISEYYMSKNDVLKKLVLLMVNKCNMRCRYCVAEQGVYKNNDISATLDIDKMATVFEKLLMIYPEGIQYVQFFGGEPLLAVEKFDKVISIIENICKEKNIKSPRYSIVTNGTLLNDNAVEIIKRNDIYTTISLDGTKATHDANRIMNDGSGTFSEIIAGVSKLDTKKLTVEFSVSDKVISCYEKGMIDNILEKYISYGFGNIVFNIIYSHYTIKAVEDNPDRYTQLLTEYVDFILREMGSNNCRLYDFAIINSMISLLGKKIERNTCTAGVGSLTLTTDGRILPCYLSSEKELDISSIGRMERYICIKAPKECTKCWCQKICNGWCREMTGGDVYEYKCIYQRLYLEKVLNYIYSAIEDKRLIKNVIQNIKKWCK